MCRTILCGRAREDFFRRRGEFGAAVSRTFVSGVEGRESFPAKVKRGGENNDERYLTMTDTVRKESQAETRVLGIIALFCYSATLAAMLTFGYSLLGLAIRAAGQDLGILLTPAGA